MSLNAEPLELKDELLRRLRERGAALTPERKAVVEALAGSPSHPTLGQVLSHVDARVPSAELATEILEELWQIGLVARIADPREGTRYDLRVGPHYHFRCASCGAFSDLPVESFVLRDATGHQIRELSVIAEGVCRDCTETAPLARALTSSLRQLTGFLALCDPVGLRDASLLPAGALQERACVRSFLALAAALDGPHQRRALDELLSRRLARWAKPFRGRALAQLAADFASRSDGWPRQQLLALLWTVARQSDSPFRKLEERVSAALETSGSPLPG